MADTNNIIPNGLRTDVMRNKMENKDALKGDGYIYIGTKNKITIEADGNTYEIPVTTGMHISEAITKYGANGLNPISISSKDDLVNTDGTLKELAKKSFSYTVSSAPVKLQDADGDKEEVIIPALSKGMVLSDTADLLVTYGDKDISGSFFYNHSDKKWTIVKANIANVLDSETMKTTNDGLIPKTSSVNLGSKDNRFKTIYADRYLVPGTQFDFQYNSDDETLTQISVLMGYSCIKPNGNTLPIDSFEFMDGKNGSPDTESHLTWIKAKGIRPYNNNEINFDLQGAEVENIYFCRDYSTNQIKNYKFMDGKDPDGTYNNYASIESAAKDIATQNFNAGSSYMFSNGNDPNDQPGGIQNLTIPAWGQGVYIKRPTNNDGAIWITDNQLERAGTRFYYINNGEARLSPIEAPFFNATSDKRLKENIIPFTSEKSILDLPVYTFNFKSDKNKKKHVGCLAQDLQEICPDLVNEDSQGYLSIEESKITYLLLEEVKELKKQVEELKGKISELEGK